ncbi:MAG: inositol monophosphatase family protein [Gammaproteobacteria bacterium]|nr:MAG: inositol monophosphatase family protein [Gammaproteobacteria bacterium]
MGTVKTSNTLPSIREIRTVIVTAAEEEIIPRFVDAVRAYKADGSIVTEADLRMQARIHEVCESSWPDYAFLGEEMTEAQHEDLLENTETGLWCVDPLDGTSNFACGIPFFSVSVALLVRGKPQLGVVYDPVRHECFSAVRGEGAWLNGQPLQVPQFSPPINKCIASIDFKRLDGEMRQKLCTPPYGSQRNFGSSALEWCWLAAGRFHLYLHGGQKLWDYSAGSLILQEAGGFACQLDGRDFFPEHFDVASVVASTNWSLFETWKDWLNS